MIERIVATDCVRFLRRGAGGGYAKIPSSRILHLDVPANRERLLS
jgi:hypothetical protein